MLLAQEMALLAIHPETGRHAIGARAPLNHALAGLLIAELVLSDAAAPGTEEGTVLVGQGPRPSQELLAATTDIVQARGPKATKVLRHFKADLRRQIGKDPWDAVIAGLVSNGALGPPSGGLRPTHALLHPAQRERQLARLRMALASEANLDIASAALVSMAAAAGLLKLLVPERQGRRAARRRIEHSLDGTVLESIGKTVRREIAAMYAGA